jgi:hypothetical protein
MEPGPASEPEPEAAAAAAPPPPDDGEHPPIVATYSEEGKLGLVFIRSEPPPLRIADITPDGLASRDGKLAIGMRLQAVQSPALGPEAVPVIDLPYADIIDVMKRAGRPVTLTFKLPPRAPPAQGSRRLQLERVQASAQRTLGAASVMLKDVQRQYTVEQQRRRGSVDGTSADNAAEQEVQYEVALPNDGKGIGMVVAQMDDGQPYVADFSAAAGPAGHHKPSRAELAGVRIGSRILAVNGA